MFDNMLNLIFLLTMLSYGGKPVMCYNYCAI